MLVELWGNAKLIAADLNASHGQSLRRYAILKQPEVVNMQQAVRLFDTLTVLLFDTEQTQFFFCGGVFQ